MRILIVEDQIDLVKNIKRFLEIEGFKVVTATSADAAEALLETETFEAIVLDLNLPGPKDGMQLCRELRTAGFLAPILILTARTAKDSILEGLNIGADDYITKPFDMDELVARVRSAIRRNHRQPNPVIEIKNVRIDTLAKKVTRDGEEIKLAPKEYALLEYLALHKNAVQERSTIIEQVWGEFDALMFSQTVDVHVAYLRKKLGKELIKTAKGGYMITD
ncbi:MAG: response regulator transcription factor [Patescibacteria group bacterium]|nr:response regulator transcription factor [Patescibacteria group bacterium]